MTNESIILNAALDLMEKGILKGSGIRGKVIDSQGNEKEIELPEQIHTFAFWKDNGYSVRKGQKAIARIKIWKYTTKILNEDTGCAEVNKANALINSQGGQESVFMKEACFFAASQVERMKAGAM